MSYDVHTTDAGTGLVNRWKALSLPWKLALGAGAIFLLSSALGGKDAPSLPPGLEPGTKLAGLQIQGEKALYHEKGIEITDVAGRWVEVRFGDDDATRRWFNFAYVAGFKLQPE